MSQMAVGDDELSDRMIALSGTANARDVGGYPTPHGQLAWRRLLRTDALDGLDDVSRGMLADLGLRTVVDLRRDEERVERPSALDGLDIRIRHIAIISGSLPSRQATIPSLDEVYSSMIDNAGPALATAIGALAEPDALPALVHCSAGKDRTGVVIGLVLALIGVNDDVIAADYAPSGGLVRERGRSTLMARLYTDEIDEATRLALDSLLESPPSLIREVLTTVRERFGGVAEYLVHHGMDPAAPDRLRSELLT